MSITHAASIFLGPFSHSVALITCPSILEIVKKVLEFKGTREDLKKSIFVLNCYGKKFFPQFHVDRNLLHLWVVGHGDREEFEPFEVQVKFQNNWAGSPLTFDMNDSVYGIEVHKYFWYNLV